MPAQLTCCPQNQQWAILTSFQICNFASLRISILASLHLPAQLFFCAQNQQSASLASLQICKLASLHLPAQLNCCPQNQQWASLASLLICLVEPWLGLSFARIGKVGISLLPTTCPDAVEGCPPLTQHVNMQTHSFLAFQHFGLFH